MSNLQDNQFIYVNYYPIISQSALSDPLQNICWLLMYNVALLKLFLLHVVLDILP